MESKTTQEVFKETLTKLGFHNHKPSQMTNSDYWLCTNTAMQEYSDQQNAYLIEALEYALQTIILQSEGKPVRDLDERISHFERILKDHGK